MKSLSIVNSSIARRVAMVLRLLLAVVFLLAATAPVVAAPSAAAAGAIAGTVTRAANGAAVAGATVTAINLSTYQNYMTVSGSDGRYLITGLPAGEYGVNVELSGFPATIYGSLYRLSVRVTDGVETPGIDVAIPDGVSISGHVYETDGVTPVPNATVYVTHSSSGTMSMALSDATGYFSVDNQHPGWYTASVMPDFASGLLSETYDNASKPADATRFEVPRPTGAAEIVFTLDRPASLSGVITAVSNGQPISDAKVFLYPVGEAIPLMPNFTTGANGAYTLPNLTPGSYYLMVTATGMLPQYYPNAYSEATATSLDLVSGASLQNINLALSRSATIAGSITASGGATPVYMASVCLYSSEGARLSYCGYTDGAGNYRIGDSDPLLPGDYYVHVSSLSSYAREFYPDSGTFAGATLIHVNPAQEITGINMTLEPGGAITGKIIPSDAPAYLLTPYVQLIGSDGAQVYEGWASTGGNYSIENIKPGQYRVSATDRDYLRGYHPSSATLEGAATVTVVAAQTVVDVNIDLTRKASLIGKVMQDDGLVTLQNIKVTAKRLLSNDEYSATTNPSGIYELPSLPAGSYIVRAEGWPTTHRTEYYPEAFTEADATPIALALGERQVVDFALDRASNSDIFSVGGGVAIKASTSLSLLFPPNAAASRVHVRIQRLSQPQTLPGKYRNLNLNYLFEAENAAGEPVNHFAKPYTLIVDYSASELGESNERGPALVWLDPADHQWKPIPFTLNTLNNRLTAQVDHFSQFSVVIVEDSKIYLPVLVK